MAALSSALLTSKMLSAEDTVISLLDVLHHRSPGFDPGDLEALFIRVNFHMKVKWGCITSPQLISTIQLLPPGKEEQSRGEEEALQLSRLFSFIS